MDAEADRAPGPRPARQPAGPRRGGSARGGASRGPGQPAADRAGRPAEPPRRLVEGEALEVAEHHRQAEGPRQAVDLAVEGLGLLAVERRLFGRRGRRLGRDARTRTGTRSWSRPPRACAGERAGPLPSGPSGSRRRRASCPAGRGRGSTGPSGPGRGRRPGRRPRHGARRPGAAGRRPAPSARAAPPARRTRPRRPDRARR